MKKTFIAILASTCLLLAPSASFADAIIGESIITLGENLTEEQKNTMLNEMGVEKDYEYIVVTNEEEHKYLGNYIPKAQIGTKAISSSKITIGEEGSGLLVTTNNISWVTEDMYKNALITAGVTDTEIYVSSPFKVSGTAGLTGIIKAYELSSDMEIPEEQKQIANEEMVTTATLGDEIGTEQANQLMTFIKEEISNNKPETKEEVKAIVLKAAEEAQVSLTEEQIDVLVSLFDRMKELDIDWNVVGEQAKEMKEKFDNFIQSEEAKGFFEKATTFFTKIVDIIKSWFN